MKTHLLIIDPQNDFCEKNGALYVAGAEDDMKRLSNFIDKYNDKINGISVTFDIHSPFHIATPVFWVDSDGCNPKPFTIIKKEDVLSGKYKASVKEYELLAKNYVIKLDENGRYDLTIWPPHCIAGSCGFGIYKELYDSLDNYSNKNYNKIEYLFKNINAFSEQYSILRSDVSLVEEENALIKSSLIRMINNNDIIFISGEALSHCVANSILDISYYISRDLSKFVLLKDTCSNVCGFEHLGESFLKKAQSFGMKVSTTLECGVYFNE